MIVTFHFSTIVFLILGYFPHGQQLSMSRGIFRGYECNGMSLGIY